MAAALASLPGFTCQKDAKQGDAQSKAGKEPRLGTLLVPNRTLTSEKNTVRILRLGEPQIVGFKIPLTKSHSIIRGTSRGEIVITECGGSQAVLFDWINGEVKNQIQAENGNVFGGHFNWWRESKLLLCTEFNQKSPAKSFVTVRDPAHAFKTVHQFESKGSRPHGVFVLEEGKTLAVQHFGEDPCKSSYSATSNYSYFELPDFKFTERKELRGDPSALDFEPTFPQGFPLPKFSEFEKNVIAHEMEFKKLINPKIKVMATTHEKHRKVLLWNVQNQKLISAYDTGQLTPVEAAATVDRSTLIVGTAEGKLIYIDLNTKRITAALPEINELPMTSHFTII